MAKPRRKRKMKNRRAFRIPEKKQWPSILKRYMTDDGLSIIVYHAAFADGAEFGPTARPRR